jgi:hypothetical protein
MKGFDRWRNRGRELAGDEEPRDPELVSLLERARAMPASQEPQRDLWSGIENQITGLTRSPQRAGWSVVSLFPRPAVALAAAGVLVATTVLTTLWIGQQAGPPSDAEVAAIAERLRERDGVSEVHQNLIAILELHRENLPLDTLNALDENLRSIDRAIAEIHLALEAHPDSHALSFMLAEAYRREVDLLERLEWWMRAPSEVRS